MTSLPDITTVREKVEISVIICSWQAPPSLDETLKTVFRQETDVDFEVVLVNNGFSQARSDQIKAAYPKIRIFNEKTPGLAHSRCTGFRAARGDFFVCIDDDNFLEAGFLSSLGKLISNFPNLGCISPVVLPRWEREPVEWLQEYGLKCLSYNALQKPGKEKKEIVWKHPNLEGCRLPFGGGMIIHRSIAEKYLAITEEKRLNFGRIGASLGGCEDVDIVYQLPLVSRDAAFSENLILYHLIPSSRLQMRYLFRLAFRSAQSWAVFQRLLKKEHHPFVMKYSLTNYFHEILRFPCIWMYGLLFKGNNNILLILSWSSKIGFVYGVLLDSITNYKLKKNY
jgi:glycosyltransferase involved in cell wall biosynthesis